MLIRSKIERKNGTRVCLGGTDYHFRPHKQGGPHVEEVTIEAHVERFLSVTEGFEPLESDEKPAEPVKKDEPQKAEAPQEPAPQEDVAPEGTGVTDEELDAIIDVLENPDTSTDEAVAASYRVLHGKAPNGKAKRGTIINQITKAAVDQRLIETD